jgi:phage shock protein PspC (stress-responsive transcriptional regulator)
MDRVDAESGGSNAGAEGAEFVGSTGGSGGDGKRLYRNEDDMVVYGVCSGIAAYFGWDPVFVRAAFGVLAFASFGTVILVYVFLMVIIPAAKTPVEKLQMRGERVNFDNLAKVVDQNVRSAIENVSPRAKRGLGKTGKLVVKVFAAIALIALFSIIVPFVVGGVLSAGMFAFVFDAFYDYFLLGYTYLAGTVIAICAVALVPLIHLIYGLIRILVNGKKMSPFLRWPLNVAFWIALVFLTVKSVEIGRGFSTSASVNYAKTCESSDTAKTIKVRTEAVPMKWEGDVDGPTKAEVEQAMGDMDVEITLNGRQHREGYDLYDLMLNRLRFAAISMKQYTFKPSIPNKKSMKDRMNEVRQAKRSRAK